MCTLAAQITQIAWPRQLLFFARLIGVKSATKWPLTDSSTAHPNTDDDNDNSACCLYMVTRRALHIDEPKARCDDRAIQILVPNYFLKLDRILRRLSRAARTPNPQIRPHSSTGARYATPAEDRSLCLVGCSIWNFSKRTPHNFEHLPEPDCGSSQQHILLMSQPTSWRPENLTIRLLT